MDLIVVDGAKRDSEFIADLEAEPSRLRMAQVMGMRGCASADGAGLAYQLTIFKLSIFKLLTAASLVTRVMQRASAWAATMMSNARAFRLRRLATVRIRA